MKKSLLLVFVLLIGVLSGSVLAQDMQPQAGGTLRAGWQSQWESLDPHLDSTESSFQILNNVLETLTFFDNDINLIPWLATSWEMSEDGHTWTFHLRNDVNFSNGRHMTAADVVWSLQRLVDPEVGSGNAWRVSGSGTVFAAVDDYTVTITTEGVQANLPASLAANKSTGIIAAESFNDDGTINTPIGTGPFVIGEIEGTTRLVLNKNENYWQEGYPLLDSVEITPITDDIARQLALEGGEVDWIFTIPPQNLQQMQDSEDVVVETAPRLSYDYLGLNLNRDPFSDGRVRQAIAMSIDRAQICAFAFFNICEPIQGPTASGTPWFYPYAPYDRNLDMARDLLDQAGVGDGFDMEIMTPIGFDETVRGAQVVQQQLAEVGINVSITNLEVGEFLERQGASDYDSFSWSWLGLTDVEDYYYLQHRTGNTFNSTGFSNERFDALVDEGRTITDFDQRYAVYQEANQILVDEAPYVYYYAKSEVKAWAPYVHDFAVRSDSAVNFWTVWMDQM